MYIIIMHFICFVVPSSSPRNVMVTGVNQASLMVSWLLPLKKNINGPITGYVIQYTRRGSSDIMSVIVNNGITHTISGLVAYVSYSVIVAAMNANGTGPFSDPPVVGRSGEDSELNFNYLHSCMCTLNMLATMLNNFDFNKCGIIL